MKSRAGQGFEIMFDVVGDNVPRHRPHLRGPSRSSDGDQDAVERHPRARARRSGHHHRSQRHQRLDVARCLRVSAGRTNQSQRTSTAPIFRRTRGFAPSCDLGGAQLHPSQPSDQEKGYGVNANSGAFPLIDGNVFYENRHAIAGTAFDVRAPGYRAWHNFVLSVAPLQRGVFHTHDFDMHGTDSGGKGGTGRRVHGSLSKHVPGNQPPQLRDPRHARAISWRSATTSRCRSLDDALSLDVGYLRKPRDRSPG